MKKYSIISTSFNNKELNENIFIFFKGNGEIRQSFMKIGSKKTNKTGNFG